jgi:carbon storage regulator
MLVITRKASESFIIGDDIKIVILDINGDKVKIGIDAPKDIIILRSEVAETINNNIEAVSATMPKDIELLKQRVKTK